MAVCEILCVGTELLLGDILNTNEQFLSKGLAQLGISVLHRSSVGDNPVRLAQELKAALGRSDIVITSGGLGPTADDLRYAARSWALSLRRTENFPSAYAAILRRGAFICPRAT